MYRDKIIAVVVPAYNEETQIARVVETMPDYVDHIVVINDRSTDRTGTVIDGLREAHPRLHPIHHEVNQGVGGAIATGYKWARDQACDVAVVMAGDGQMDPVDLPAILDPVVEGRADFSKGNRLIFGNAYQLIPKVRYFGNQTLSFFTKICSGYWHVADSQSGYTAIDRQALEVIDWDLMYKRYGQPNDLLVRLNVYNFRVRDVPIRPVYNVGEQSKMRIKKVIFTIPLLLVRMFLYRIKEKYLIRDFHPLVFFYFLGLVMFLISMILLVRTFIVWMEIDKLPELNVIAMMFSFTTSFQSVFFAMWMDMDYNKDLK